MERCSQGWGPLTEAAAGLGTEFLSVKEQFRTDQCRKSCLVGELHKHSALWPAVFASANNESTRCPLVGVRPGTSCYQS